ncbi:hypothetical protein [Pseudomonas sp. NBRC 111119]|uniref:hypothetical protein n=1 Tax=Pseudomonas sp. NBRC 111119 TaxID=1661034 RepID=UPI000760C729|nr:hypothetical protein [Pseudomonas sp. NBRC 111119]
MDYSSMVESLNKMLKATADARERRGESVEVKVAAEEQADSCESEQLEQLSWKADSRPRMNRLVVARDGRCTP